MAENTDPEKTVDITPSPSDWAVAPTAALGPDEAPAGAGNSVLASLARAISSVPRVMLRESVDGAEPVVRLNSDALPAGDPGSRYQLHGEIARGGMGSILKGRDTDLGRDLAIKVLLDSHKDKPEVIQRFVEEAQISGQLQHPGIVPVYDLGQFSDERPFFTMKLVKGQTLAAILEARKQLGDDRAKLLGIFEQVCQTMAYAHSRGVIHRDLKPANIMVGAFGEVQVMDWGLAKVLAAGGVADEKKSHESRAAVSVIRTVRTVGSETPCSVGSDTVMGAVLGTPGYMSPEQARGDVDLIDERADVFGLGAILCQILTGSPPFTGKGPEAMRKTQTSSLDDVHQRLEECGEDAALIAIAKHCLAAEPWDRPRNAGLLATELSQYFESVADRLHQAELDRLEAATRAAEQQKRRRVLLALAASVLVTCGVAGGSWLWTQQQLAEADRVKAQRDADLAQARTDKAIHEAELAEFRAIAAEELSRRQRQEADDRAKLAQQIHSALAEAQRLRTQAEAAVEADEAALVPALEASRRAEALLATGPADAELANQVRALVVELDEQHKGRSLLAAANQARLASSDAENDQNHELSRKALETVFTDYGFPAAETDPAAFGRWIRQHPPAVRDGLIAALDYWKLIGGQPADWITSALTAADDDPWRARLRQARSNQRTALIELAKDPRAIEQPSSAVQLAKSLMAATPAAAEESVALLRRAHQRHPDDFWINYWLADELRSTVVNRPSESVSYAMIAVSLAPKSRFAHCALGKSLRDQGKYLEAIAAYRTALAIDPNHTSSHHNLAVALGNQGRSGEAYGEYELVIAAYKKGIELNPKSSVTHYNLGQVLRLQGRLDEAVAAYRTTVQLNPKYTLAHSQLGFTLERQSKLGEAVVAYRAAVQLQPQVAGRQSALAAALEKLGRLNEAADAYRAAARLEPNSGFRHSDLGNVLMNQGKVDDAIAALRTAIRLDPRRAISYSNLGLALAKKGTLTDAVDMHRTAIRLDPKRAVSHANLASALISQGKLDEAVSAQRAVIELEPARAANYRSLAQTLERQGKLDDAVAAFRTAIKLEPNTGIGHTSLGHVLARQGKLAEALEEHRTAMTLEPQFASRHSHLGDALASLGKLDDAIEEYRKAIALDPKHAVSYRGLGTALDKQGKLDEAGAAYQRAAELDPKQALLQYRLGQELRAQGKLNEAIEAYRTAIKLEPTQVLSYYNLALVLEIQGKLDEAVETFRTAIEVDPAYGCSHHSLGATLAKQGKLAEAVEACRTAIGLDPSHAGSHNALGFALAMDAKPNEAIKAYRTAIELSPEFGDAHHNLADTLINQGRFAEALAALERGQRLASGSPAWTNTWPRSIKRAERLIELEAKLPEVLQGRTSPAGAVERLEYSEVCHYKKQFAAAARLAGEALAADPQVKGVRRYNAACSAAMAANTQEAGEPLDDAQRADWRKQSLEWLRAELAVNSSQLETGRPNDLRAAHDELHHWQRDHDLRSIRDAAELAKLPADEREPLAQFWADVESLRQKAAERLRQ